MELSNFKLLLYPAFLGLAKMLAPSDELATQVIFATIARYFVNYGFNAFAHSEGYAQRYRIQHKNPPPEQLLRELDFDDPLIGSVAAFLLVQVCTPWLDHIVDFSWRGLGICFFAHYFIVEPVYYVYHVILHWPKAYKYSHSHHHSSVVTEAISGTSHPWYEALGYLTIFSFPILVPAWCGVLSYETIYVYFVFFDIMNCIGHCNVEIVPVWLQWGPLKYVFYSASYHTLHHTRYKANYCLFCPVWDHIFGTVSSESYTLQRTKREGKGVKPAQAVFIGHGFGWSSLFHHPMVSAYLATQEHVPRVWMYPFFPLCVLGSAVCRRVVKCCFVVQRYSYKKLNCATWSMPVLAYAYASKAEYPYLNSLLLEAIRDAEAQGATHVGLGALNKAQFLNGGGQDLLPHLHADCRVKIVHGNTLTAAVTYSRVRQHTNPTDEILFTGATSMVGTAVALRLLQDGYRLRILTRSQERFEKIVASAGDNKGNLERVERYEEGVGCKVWLLGSPLNRQVGNMVAADTAFFEFAVPRTSDEYVRPCKVTPAASVGIDGQVTDLTMCHDRGRGSVPACLAATIIHSLEGFSVHEVGDVDVSRMDHWLELAKKHQFKI